MQNMTQTTGKTTLGLANNDQYLELLTSFPPRPIASEDDLRATQKLIDFLIDKEELTQDEQDYLNILGNLVRDYEDLYHPMPKQDAVKVLKTLLEDSDLKTKDLLAIFPNESSITDILLQRKELTIDQVKKIADFFKISPDAFLG
jgi:HTH-type transcriptional regulator/antitoxin HigA